MSDAAPTMEDEPTTPAAVEPAGSLQGGLPADASASPDHERRVIAELRARGGALFALIDAARDPLVFARLLGCQEEHQSLYEGPRADRLADVAPYLVALPAGTRSLETLVREGWGRSWGVYLACDRPFGEVRKHLRRFLTVQVEDGKNLLFRYYDPRVLRAYLPSCTPEEAAEFFGPIREFILEGEDPQTVTIFARDRLSPDAAEVCTEMATGGDS